MYKKDLFIGGCFLLASGAFSASAAIVGDINGDGKVDLTESIFALQVASGAYPSANPSCQLAGKGNWAQSTLYSECDVIKSGDSHYICTETHTSSPAFTTDSAKWTKLVLASNWEKNNNIIYYTGGNVGIGTTTPTTKLEVSGGIKLLDPALTQGKGWLFYPSTNGTDADMRLYETATSSSGDRLTFQSGGNVGIGTTSPGAKLDILTTGTGYSTKIANLNTNETAWGLSVATASGSANSYIADFRSGSTTVMAIKGDGTVGIGTTAPSSGLKLDVEGKVGASEYCDENGANCNSVADLWEGPWSENSGNISLSSGKVGIGTSNPAVALQVEGADLAFGTTNFNATLALANNTNTPSIAFGGTSGLGALIKEEYGSLSFYTGERATGSWGGQARMLIQNNGRVGIGTASIGAHQLTVQGTIKSNSGFVFPDETIQGTAVEDLWTDGGDFIYAKNNMNMVVMDNGNVGVGTNGPSSKFMVFGVGEPLAHFKSYADISVQITGNGGESYLEISNDLTTASNSWKMGLNDINRLDFSYGDAHSLNNSTEFMSMTTTGNVGIGTTSPGTKLHVYNLTDAEPIAHFESGGDVAIRINGQDGESYVEFQNDDTTTTNSWKVGLNDRNRLDLQYGSAGDMNGDNVGISVSTAGYVYKPKLPYFKVEGDTTVVSTGGQATVQLEFAREDFDNGNNFDLSTNKFTAPVKGLYSFSWRASHGNGYGDTGGIVGYFFPAYLKTSDTNTADPSKAEYPEVSHDQTYDQTTILLLSAGETVEIESYTFDELSMHNPIFSGYLITALD